MYPPICHWCLQFSLFLSTSLLALCSQTATGIFFDAQVRGTGDVVNSLKIRQWVGLGREPYEWWCQVAVWRDTMTFLLFRDGGTSLALVAARGSEQTAMVQNLRWMNESVLWFASCFKPVYLSVSHRGGCFCGSTLLLMQRSCTRLLRSGFARCTACRWAPQCTSWSCWYWGWTWLWTDLWPGHRSRRKIIA